MSKQEFRVTKQEFHDTINAYFETGNLDYLKLLAKLTETEQSSRDASRMRGDATFNDAANAKIAVRIAEHQSMGSPRM